MTTTTKAMPRAKKPPSIKKKSFSPEEIDQAIQSEFRNTNGRISIRHLWTNEFVHRFRVNWWINGEIDKSKFIVVTEENKQLTIREIK